MGSRQIRDFQHLELKYIWEAIVYAFETGNELTRSLALSDFIKRKANNKPKPLPSNMKRWYAKPEDFETEFKELNLTDEIFRDKHKKLTYKKLKAVIIKKIYGNLDYLFKSSPKPMMSFILENKTKDKRKDTDDKETHIHGIREVFDENIDYKVRTALKTSVCNGKKEYQEPKYRNMLQTKDKYNNDKSGAKGWLWYLNKGVCCNNGLYISQPLLEKIRNDYEQLYKEYKENIKLLKEKGFKIKYEKPERITQSANASNQPS